MFLKLVFLQMANILQGVRENRKLSNFSEKKNLTTKILYLVNIEQITFQLLVSFFQIYSWNTRKRRTVRWYSLRVPGRMVLRMDYNTVLVWIKLLWTTWYCASQLLKGTVSVQYSKMIIYNDIISTDANMDLSVLCLSL